MISVHKIQILSYQTTSSHEVAPRCGPHPNLFLIKTWHQLERPRHMDLFAFIFWLAVLWLCIHALPHILSRLFSRSSIFRSSSPPLPLTSASASRRSHKKTALESNWKSRHWTVHVSKLHFRISSTVLNNWHETLFRPSSYYAGSGMKQGNEHRRRLATLFYDLGSISGAVGMVLGILGLVWTWTWTG